MSRALWIAGVGLWLSGASAAIIYADVLRSNLLGWAVFAVLVVPVALAAWVALEAVAESGVMALVIAAFKLVTFGLARTEFTSKIVDFPWYGFARDHDGTLAASESAVFVIGVITWAMGITAAYLWFLR